MIQREAEVRQLGAEVLLVAYDERSLLAAKVLRDIALPYPLLVDSSKETYRAWGMGRTNLLGAMLSPMLNWRYFKLLLRGERFLGFAPDMFQLGGDFVVNGGGELEFAHRMRNNGDRASTEVLFGALGGAAST